MFVFWLFFSTFLYQPNAYSQNPTDDESLLPEKTNLENAPATVSTTPFDRGSVSTFWLAPWYSHPKGGAEEFNFRARGRSDFWVNLTSDGCYRMRARLTTGQNFNNEFVNIGVGTNNANMTLALRHLYLSAECLDRYLKKIPLSEKTRSALFKNYETVGFSSEVGSIPTNSYGNLGLYNTGYIDGVSFLWQQQPRNKDEVVNFKLGAREWRSSIGHIDNDAHLFSRGDFFDINHLNIQMQQNIQFRDNNGKLQEGSAHISAAHYQDKYYLRSGANWNIKQNISFPKRITHREFLLNEFGVDFLVSNTKWIGEMFYLKIDLGKWDTRLVLSRIEPDQSQSQKLAMVLKQFYGYGGNVLVESTRKITSRKTLTLIGRVGQAGPLGAVIFAYTPNWNRAAPAVQKP